MTLEPDRQLSIALAVYDRLGHPASWSEGEGADPSETALRIRALETEGLSYKTIARRLGVSYRTVMRHKERQAS